MVTIPQKAGEPLSKLGRRALSRRSSPLGGITSFTVPRTKAVSCSRGHIDVAIWKFAADLQPHSLELGCSVPLAFRRIQAANLVGWSGALPHAAFEDLAMAVGGILEKQAARHASAPQRTSEAPVIQPPTLQRLIAG
jgi:hypothetical protein